MLNFTFLSLMTEFQEHFDKVLYVCMFYINQTYIYVSLLIHYLVSENATTILHF